MLKKASSFRSIALAVAVISLSACSTTKQGVQYPVDQVASAIGETGTRIWEGTKHLFKLKDRSKKAEEIEITDEFMDEVDLALLEDEDFNDVAIAQGVEGVPLLPEDGMVQIPEAQNAEVELLINETPATDVAAIALDGPESNDPQSLFVGESNEDLFHTVGRDETLWDLSKKLTGDATNWKLLAEINNLDEAGSLFHGMKLRIPASMRKPLQAADTETVLAQAKLTQAKTDDLPSVVAAAVVPTSSDVKDVAFTVAAGESLWDLAGRTTGDPTQWDAIATHNGMNEQEANHIRYGQTILVPVAMVKQGVAGSPAPAMDQSAPTLATLPAKKQAADAVATIIAPTNKPEEAVGEPSGTELIAANTAQALPAEGELVTVDANFKAAPPKIAVPKAQAEQTLVADVKKKGSEIMVSGTYYPKAIYNDANFSASLLMRVSPGTRLKVSRALGPWYEVVTEKGVGFVHSRDTK